MPPYLSVQAVTYLGPQPPGLQARRPELTQAEFRFLSEEVGRAAWGSEGTGTSLSCSFSGGRLDSQRNSWEPLATPPPAKPTAPEVRVGLMLTHLKALSTGSPKEPPAHPRRVSSWSVTCEVWSGKADLRLAIQPRNPKDRNLPSGEETQAQGGCGPPRLPPPQRSGLQPQREARQPLSHGLGAMDTSCHQPRAHMETAMQKSRGRQAETATKL